MTDSAHVDSLDVTEALVVFVVVGCGHFVDVMVILIYA